MSFNARRLANDAVTEKYDWGSTASAMPIPAPPAASVAGTRSTEVVDVSQLAAVERDAFTKGYAQGERAGAEAAAARGQAMLRRLGQTIEELSALRADMIRRTERQMVQLSLAIARRVVSREVSIDRGLLAAMARVAIDRLGEHASASIRLHPDDYAAVMAGQPALDAGSQISIVADPLVARGGCMVRSDFGFMDVSPESQFEELAKSLLEDTDSVPVHVAATVAAASAKPSEGPVAD